MGAPMRAAARRPDRIGVPTLVVTGGWNDEYEAIASRIVGARHVTLAGHGHRPQDHPDAAGVVRSFLGGD
jgi:hypothetical protein